MTLIDYFNAFHVRSQEFSLSANTRSLYFAILAEFNKLQYPQQLKLHNTYLQHLSGINSTSSFRSALSALINAEVISQKKQVYFLKDFRNTSETLSKDFRNSFERVSKDSLVSNSGEVCLKKKEKEKNKEKEETTTTAETRAREGFLKETSPEIAETWLKYEGEKLSGGQMIDLYGLEKLYGKDAVIAAIIEASRSNKYQRLTYNFVKAVLESQQKGGSKNAGNSATVKRVANAGSPEDWEQQCPDWLND